ncbi:hypothetical protein DFP98_13654 [Cohnella phaseoli]|uniref:Uncharacterized protein n=1 Tax=Cohnella phaseoli TaxID=456490 RepID=A0A3D9I751_9BACL|nr:hypothetical protein DFP98_13654 [Cohnella phaseoli]
MQGIWHLNFGVRSGSGQKERLLVLKESGHFLRKVIKDQPHSL